jgi:hypothetical protein
MCTDKGIDTQYFRETGLQVLDRVSGHITALGYCKTKRAHTALTSARKVLRTIERMRAMAREILETSEQSRGRAMMGKDYCKASPGG